MVALFSQQVDSRYTLKINSQLDQVHSFDGMETTEPQQPHKQVAQRAQLYQVQTLVEVAQLVRALLVL
jgi:hypothetical protein